MKESLGQLQFSVRWMVALLMCVGVAGFADDLSLGQPAYRDGQFYFDVHGESKAGYVVLRTTDFSEWTPLATNEAAEKGTSKTAGSGA